jgi:hypothetical protein
LSFFAVDTCLKLSARCGQVQEALEPELSRTLLQFGGHQVEDSATVRGQRGNKMQGCRLGAGSGAKHTAGQYLQCTATMSPYLRCHDSAALTLGNLSRPITHPVKWAHCTVCTAHTCSQFLEGLREGSRTLNIPAQLQTAQGTE